jgi:hypothetical protein
MTDAYDKIKDLEKQMEEAKAEVAFLKFIAVLEKCTPSPEEQVKLFDQQRLWRLVRAIFEVSKDKLEVSGGSQEYSGTWRAPRESIHTFSVPLTEKTSDFSKDLIAVIKKHRHSLGDLASVKEYRG